MGGEPEAPPRVLRLCLDLNVWCAAILSHRRGLQPTAAQFLTDIARAGIVGLVPVQLIVSWGMLDRLRRVLTEQLHISDDVVEASIDAIHLMAAHGPERRPPHLLLGGTGALPLPDAEDAGVLQVALAARAHFLATANLVDFVSPDMEILVPDEVGIHRAPGHELVVAMPQRVAGWLREGAYPDAGFARSHAKARP